MAGPTSRSPGRLSSDPAAPELVWRAGDPRYAEPLAPLVRSLLGKGDAVEILRDKPGRRRLARGVLPDGEAVFMKHLLPARRWDARWKRRLGGSPGAREFRTMVRLHAAQVPVAPALALFESPAGDSVVVMRFLAGEPFARALERPGRERRALLQAVGRAIARLHRARTAHRDLHRENVWVTRDGPVLIDLQQATRLLHDGLRLRDLGQIDASLSELLSLPDRVRLRAAALGVNRPFDAKARARIRQLGRVSDLRLHTHFESRTRRALAEGRLYARFRCRDGRGMRLRTRPEDEARRAFEGAGPGLLRFHSSGLARGSPARSAWLAGHGLRARGIAAPEPRAFVEHRTASGVRSALWLEASAEAATIDAKELLALGVALRSRQVAIGPEARLCRTPEGELGLCGLESVRFRRRLSPREAARVDAFVASALRQAVGEEEEREALERYARRLRFYDAEMVIQRK